MGTVVPVTVFCAEPEPCADAVLKSTPVAEMAPDCVAATTVTVADTVRTTVSVAVSEGDELCVPEGVTV